MAFVASDAGRDIVTPPFKDFLIIFTVAHKCPGHENHVCTTFGKKTFVPGRILKTTGWRQNKVKPLSLEGFCIGQGDGFLLVGVGANGMGQLYCWRPKLHNVDVGFPLFQITGHVLQRKAIGNILAADLNFNQKFFAAGLTYLFKCLHCQGTGNSIAIRPAIEIRRKGLCHQGTPIAHIEAAPIYAELLKLAARQGQIRP